MRLMKPFAVGVAGAALLAVPFAGVSLAATSPVKDPARTTTTTHPTTRPEDRAVSIVKDDSRLSVKAEVAPGEVAAGHSYRVTILAAGARRDTTATVKSPQGATYTVTLKDGRATKTLTVPRTTKPGRYRVGVTVAGRVTTAEFTVTRDDDRNRDHHPSGR
ncbi:hypothetical protein ACIBG4_26380 [Nonomuraea sp. NPDC050383]|uniref:hypothetical protein n=1 Tax=Nonomuraea sp. NPDC050383 TaxID=3364362 RepID=UPI003797EDF1